MELIRESWGWGLPQAAIALAFAGALGIATVLVLHNRGPKNRLAREGPAYAWALLYVAGGVFVWLLAGYAHALTIASSTVGIGVELGLIVAVIASPFWYGQLFVLGAAAGRLGGRSMHLMLGATTLAGAAAA